MAMTRKIPLIITCLLLTSCAANQGPEIVARKVNLATESCKTLEEGMITAYIVVSGREKGIRKARKDKRFKRLEQFDKKRADKIINRIVSHRIKPYVKNYKKVSGAYRKKCKWPSRKLEEARRKYPSKMIGKS